mmetsp:Transcript_30110/g.49790  ORF Transcript_30110/g.49790 Transcript_30110/m.49790 type:complete len:245 (-) Transcript_30110:223-957(-)
MAEWAYFGHLRPTAASGGLHVHHAGLTTLVLDDLLSHHGLPTILVGFGHLLLQVDDGLGWVQALRAAVGAVHDAMATVQLHGVVDPCQTLLSELIPGVSNPTIGLHQNSWAQVVLWVPPVGWARGHAASAQDALIHPIELGPVLAALEIFLVTLGFDVLALQPRLDGLVLVVKVCEVRNKILYDVGVRKRLNFDRLAAWLNVEQASKAILAVDVHGTRAADSLTAGSSESQCRVDLIFDLDESI